MHVALATLISRYVYCTLAVLVSGYERRGPHFRADLIPLVEFTNSTGGSLNCPIHSAEPVKIRWVDGNLNDVVTSPKVRYMMPNGTLKFPPFAEGLFQRDVHRTEYRCAGSSAFGSVLSTPLCVRAAVAAPYRVALMDMEVYPGGTAILSCIVPRDLHGEVQVTHWMAGSRKIDYGQVFGVGSKYVPMGRNLLVNSIQHPDTKVSYRCYTRNRITNQLAASSASRMFIVNSTQPAPPELYQESFSHVSANLGTDVLLICNVQGFPLPSYSWFKVYKDHNESLLDDRRKTIGGPWVLIRDAIPNDSGNYRCQAANDHGVVEAKIRLTVHGHLAVFIQPEFQIAKIGETVDFTCNFTGNLPSAAVIAWRYNTVQIQANVNVVFPQPHVLRIIAATIEHAGVYQCFALVNYKTEVQASAELTVRDHLMRFSSVFNEQSVYPMRPVSLHCFATGVPLPQIRWEHDGVPLPFTSGRVTVQSSTDSKDPIVKSYVNISSTDIEDGGFYCCSTEEEKHCASLNVYGPVTAKWSRNETAAAGEDYFLHCPYSGYPVTSVIWMRNKEVIKSSEKYRTFANGTLRISTLDQLNDSGEYSCHVRGTGSSVAQSSVYVNVKRPPAIENFRFPLNAQEGGRAQVTCSISSGDLPIDITWFKDGKPMPHLNNVESQTGEFHSILIFKNLGTEHSGLYACQAKNSASVASHKATLTVRVVPRWVVEPYDQSVLAGDRVKFVCLAFGVPVPSVSWYKVEDGQQVLVIPTNTHSVSKDGILVIQNVQKKDSASYVCKATNHLGSSITEAVSLRVNVPPQVKISHEKVVLPSGSSVVWDCQVTGDEPLVVRWKASDEIIENDARFSIVSTKEDKKIVLSLSLSKLTGKDSGTYFCEAVNDFGIDYSQTRLIIEELPKPPESIHIGAKASRSVEIFWIHNVPNEFTSYLVELTRSNGFETANHTIEQGRNFAYISNLTPFSSYRVRVYAVNKVGLSQPSVEVRFQTMEEAPTGMPRHPSAEARSPRTVLVSWLPPVEEGHNGRIVTYVVSYQDREKLNVAKKRAVPAKTSEQMRHREAVRHEVLLDNLLPATLYSITIQAMNRLGIGPSTALIVVSTPETAPSAAPLDFRCDSVSPFSVHLTWAPPPLGTTNGLVHGYKASYSHSLRMSSNIQMTHAESKKTGNVLYSTIYGLQPSTNYTFKVAAYTSGGLGPYSKPAFCRTEEDSPKPPENVKVIGTSATSAVVLWQTRYASLNPGSLRYTVQMREVDSQHHVNFLVDDSSVSKLEIHSLTENKQYRFSVHAVAKAEDGPSSPVQLFTATAKVPARILGFSRTVTSRSNFRLHLECATIGPHILKQFWTYGGEDVSNVLDESHYVIEADGSLVIQDATDRHAGEYTCTVQNMYGRDSVAYTVTIVDVPMAPILFVGSTTVSSITVVWNKDVKNNQRILEYTLYYRKLGATWQRQVVEGSEESTRLEGLDCGTLYEFQIEARNPFGRSLKSEVIRAMTRGSGLLLPEVEEFFSEVPNAPSSLILHLDHWPSGGCRILAMQIEKRNLLTNGAHEWQTLAGNISPDEQPMFVVQEVSLTQKFQLKVTAFTQSESRVALFTVARETNLQGSRYSIQRGSTSSPHLTSESIIIVVCLSVSAMMLLSSMAAVIYVLYKRRAIPRKSDKDVMNAAADSTIYERPKHGRNVSASSVYSQRKSIAQGNRSETDEDDDEEITPYATFTLKPISSEQTTHSLMAAPPSGGSDNHSWYSIEMELCGGRQVLTDHPAELCRRFNVSPVPPHRSSEPENFSYSATQAPTIQCGSRRRDKRRDSNNEILKPPPRFSDLRAKGTRTWSNKSESSSFGANKF